MANAIETKLNVITTKFAQTFDREAKSNAYSQGTKLSHGMIAQNNEQALQDDVRFGIIATYSAFESCGGTNRPGISWLCGAGGALVDIVKSPLTLAALGKDAWDVADNSVAEIWAK